jgi:hypothetical protein
MHTESIRDTQAGTEVMRILDSIQHQKQRGLSEGIEHIVDIHIRTGGVDTRNYALVPGTTRQSHKPCTVACNQPYTLGFCQRRQIAGTLIPSLRIEENLPDAGRILAQPAGNRMETEYKTRAGHLW